MKTIELQHADGHLSEIIHTLLPGEEIVLTQGNQPVATIRSTIGPRKVPQFGTMKGTILYIAPDFDDIPEGFGFGQTEPYAAAALPANRRNW